MTFLPFGAGESFGENLFLIERYLVNTSFLMKQPSSNARSESLHSLKNGLHSDQIPAWSDRVEL